MSKYTDEERDILIDELVASVHGTLDAQKDMLSMFPLLEREIWTQHFMINFLLGKMLWNNWVSTAEAKTMIAVARAQAQNGAPQALAKKDEGSTSEEPDPFKDAPPFSADTLKFGDFWKAFGAERPEDCGYRFDIRPLDERYDGEGGPTGEKPTSEGGPDT